MLVIVVVGTSSTAHIPDIGIVGILSFSDSTDGLDVEIVGDLEVDTPFHTVVDLIDACHRDIRERVDVIIIEVLPFGFILHRTIVAADVGLHEWGLDLIADFGTENLLVLKVGDEVVADLRRDESRTGLWSFPLVADTEGDDVTHTEVVGQTSFGTTVQEEGGWTLAIRVLWRHTVTHLSISGYLCAADTSADKRVQTTAVIFV